MSLAAVAARRLLLRRGVGALAAMFVTAGKSDIGPSGLPGLGSGSQGRSAAPQAPTEDATYRQRSLLARPFSLERERHWRRKNIRYQAWNQQDSDLMTLHSTSQAWRASVMFDRLNSEASIMDTFEERLNAIWEEPLDKVQRLIAVWLKGAL